MIVKKRWREIVKDYHGEMVCLNYCGWFLFGCMPLYIDREGYPFR